MRLFIRLIAAGILAALLSAGSAFAQRDSFEIRGDVQKPRSWTVDDVKKQFAEEVRTAKSTFGAEKQERISTGIPLISLLRASELKTAETPKHYDFSFIVIIEAYDGYRAWFSFAELAVGEKENPVLLIWEENGKPIPDNETPFRLRVDSSRSIFGITRITLVDGIKLAESLK